MQTGTESYQIEENGWVVRVQPPSEETPEPRTLLLLHGWLGNETVMWIFTGRLPRQYWMFAPRGIFKGEGGYGWVRHSDSLPALDEFASPAEQLIKAFHDWAEQAGAPHATFDVMGFSQGAAMAYALGTFYPRQVNRVIALAGFLPEDRHNRYGAYRGKKVYVAHGTADETVPVTNAQDAVRTLQDHGAQVTYCESDSGHKLSAGCLRGLEAFLR